MKTLLEKRALAAAEIRRLADLANDDKHAWTPEDEAAWKAANDSFDALTAQLERSARAGQVEEVLDAPGEADPQIGILRDRSYRDEVRAEAELAGEEYRTAPRPAGMAFRDVRSGREHRALRPDQQLAPQMSDELAGKVLAYALANRLDELPREYRDAQIGGVDPLGGFFLGGAVSGKIIDLARSASVVLTAGAQTLPVEDSELHLVKISQDATGYWRPESAKVTASNIEISRLTLKPRMLACIVPCSVELLEDAPNAGPAILAAVRSAIAGEIDRVALLGTGSASEPLGLQNVTGINAVTSVGTPTDYSDYSAGVQQVLEANYPGAISGLSWVLHPRDAGILDGLVSATEGQPLEPTPWCRELRKFFTTKLPTTLGGGGESIGFVGDFSQLVLGMRTRGIRVRIAEDGQVTDAASKVYNATSQLLKLVIAYVRCDVAIMRPEWFTLLSGITIT